MLDLKNYSFENDKYVFSVGISVDSKHVLAIKVENKHRDTRRSTAWFYITERLLDTLSTRNLNNFLNISAEAYFRYGDMDVSPKMIVPNHRAFNHYEIKTAISKIALRDAPNANTYFKATMLYNFHSSHQVKSAFGGYWRKWTNVINHNKKIVEDYSYSAMSAHYLLAFSISMYSFSFMENDLILAMFKKHFSPLQKIKNIEGYSLLIRNAVYFVKYIASVRASLDNNVSMLTRRLFDQCSDLFIYLKLLKARTKIDGLEEWLKKTDADGIALSVVFGNHSIANKRRRDAVLKLANDYSEYMYSPFVALELTANVSVFRGAFIAEIAKKEGIVVETNNGASNGLDRYFAELSSYYNHINCLLVDNNAEINYVVSLLINNLGVKRAFEIIEEVQAQRLFVYKESAPSYAHWKRYVEGYDSKGYGRLPLSWALDLTNRKYA